MVQRVTSGDTDIDRDILDLIDEVVPQSQQWLDTPHNLLGSEKPRQLIGTNREFILRNLVRALKQGQFS